MKREERLTCDSPSVRVLFQLLRIALGKEDPSPMPDDVNWEEVYELSLHQGVGAIACDGLLALKECNINPILKYKWMGQSMVIEKKYYQQQKALLELNAFYQQQGIQLMLLKGIGLSLNYPIPKHRPSDDLDIFLFDPNDKTPQWEKGDEAIRNILKIDVDDSHHHHTTFSYQDVSVENHFDFINIYSHRSSKRIEQVLKSWALTDCLAIEQSPNTIVLPPTKFNALFILKHNALHFSVKGMSLRHVLDWLLFVEKYGKSVEWEQVCPVYQQENLFQFASILNTIGTKYLGFSQESFLSYSTDEKIVERVADDIIHPEFDEKGKSTLASALWVKPRRWWHNRWKHNLCYPDSLLSSFLYSLYAKILKPSHFIH